MPDTVSREALIAYLAEGHEVQYLFFWGHTAKDKNTVGKECLSQWYPADFEIEGVRYPTAEHYMMAEKARVISEGAGALPVAAALTGRAGPGPIVAVISGGNIDLEKFCTLIGAAPGQ